MIIINLFNIISEDFFKPLTSKYKTTYIDCIRLIYNTYKTELSFGVDKEVILAELESYFEDQSSEDMIFDDNEEIAKDSRAKANAILRNLKDSGWLEYEVSNDYRVKINLFDYAATMIESFNKILKNEEMEYQSLVSQIHATLLNKEAYVKPYEYIIKRVVENTEELITGLKKLNTNIKKYIDAITNEKTAGEIVQDFFVYHKDIGSKAYHRIKTSDNISHFRTSIIENLYNILNDKNIFERAVLGYMEIEQVEEKVEAEDLLRGKILNVISAFRNYDDIISEIDNKNAKYIGSAVARAKFLLTNTNNTEGKISKILAYLSDEFNRDETINLYDEVDDTLLNVFNIFPQGFIDSDSLYVVPISRKMSMPQELSSTLGISEDERERRKLALHEKNKNRFSRKNINTYIEELLRDKQAVLASTLPLDTKRDLIRIIFINLYGKDKKSMYKTTQTNEVITVNDFRFSDFVIERCE
ncbi:Wadjet anti-phage system protein JetA family protein [Robertmurraya massiliosenegalensis]|uniref:Wadjet anti-phage system protein JetA family protein n=1 Tax=Robertmurraya massiliosenegalensis TaxID=1287657 RepID=UPI00035DAC11|nr:Wadjet anti-phage system protein JetA family protein [Robertmurraya massiliosenegalensis]